MGDDESLDEDSTEGEPLDEEALFIQNEINECFAVFDEKNTGRFPSKFLEKALESLGIILDSFEIDNILEKYDKEGSISLADFHYVVGEKLKEIEAATHLKNAFLAFDQEKEGVIPTDRLKRWLTTLGDPLTDSEAKELCKMGDPAGKGVFTYADATAVLLN